MILAFDLILFSCKFSFLVYVGTLLYGWRKKKRKNKQSSDLRWKNLFPRREENLIWQTLNLIWLENLCFFFYMYTEFSL